MHNLYESKDAVYIVTDLASGGELFQQLLTKGSYTEKDASHLTRQMLQGLLYLHERDVGRLFCLFVFILIHILYINIDCSS
jgi:calcium/calmodulin-dependent protein kinase I